MAGYLKNIVVLDQDIPMQANEPRIELPRDLLYMMWVQLSNTLLTPTSTYAINSGAVTTQTSQTSGSWLTATPGLPNRYAIEGRELILNPPPTAAVIAQTPFLTWRYMGTGTVWTEQSEIGLGVGGQPGLSALDEDLLMYYAAQEWISGRLINMKAEQLPAAQAQIAELEKQIARRLPEAKRRWMTRIDDYLPTSRPDTSGRLSSGGTR